MKIGLVDVDGHNFPNLALMKLSTHHKRLGHSVEWHNPLQRYDTVYMAKVFADSKDYDHMIMCDDIVCGGTGYHIYGKLPHEVEHSMPDYTLYPQYTEAYGFLTRGCPRDCTFCIVTQKEGRQSEKVADLSEFWNGQKQIKLLDPNLLACPYREELLWQLVESKALVDFTQGLDARLLTEYMAEITTKIKIKQVHFAWDSMGSHDTIIVDNIQRYMRMSGIKIPNISCYVLINHGTTEEQDLHRIYKLREIGVDPYVMVYDKRHASRRKRMMQRWVNNRIIWSKCKRFEDYKHE